MVGLLCCCGEPRKKITEFSDAAIEFCINLVVAGKGKKVAKFKQLIWDFGAPGVTH